MEEFKYRAFESRAAPVTATPPTTPPLPAVPYVPERSLQERELAPVGFYGNVPSPAVFRTPVVVPGQVSGGGEMETREQIRRQVEKAEIRREIIAGEMAAARRRELEDEVRRELAAERALAIQMPPRADGLLGGAQPLHHRVFNTSKVHACSLINNKDKVAVLARPDADVSVAKRKTVSPSAVDDVEQSATSLQKKPKHDWSCELCHITTTGEKGLNDHLRGKKHKAKEAALIAPKIGLDPRPGPNIQTLFPNIIPPDIGMLEHRQVDKAEQVSQGLGGLEMENEIVTGKEAVETSASTPKKFQFWCALCEVHTRSEAVMHSHKVGKRHLTNLKKASEINGG